MLQPKIRDLKVCGNALDCELVLEENDLCFEGHFPEYKLLPGVSQLHFVMQLAREHLGVPATFSKIVKLKFKSPVRPGMSPHLHAEFAAGTLNFTITNGEKVCATGSFVE